MLKDLRLQKIYRDFAAETKAAETAEDAPRTLVVKISSPTPDRSNDTVQPSGMNADNFMKNPVVPFAHNYSELPIAKCTGLKVSDTGILATVEFPKKGVYEKSDVVYQMYKDGFLSGWSIGFMASDYEENDLGGYNFTKWELLEFSSVPVPANPEALTIMRSKGINVDALIDEKKEEKTEEKTAEQIAAEEKEAKEKETKAAGDTEDADDDTAYTEDMKVGELTIAQYTDLLQAVFGLPDDDAPDNSDTADGDQGKAVKRVVAKDVNEVIALSYVLDCLDYFISYFKSNGVKQDDIDKLTQALALVMEVTQSQAELGQKAFKIEKSGRTLSAENEEKLKAAQDHMAKATEHVKDVLTTVNNNSGEDDEPVEDGKGLTTKLFRQITASKRTFKEADKQIGLTLKLFKIIESEKGGEK